MKNWFILFVALIAFASCQKSVQTTKVYLTSEDGQKCEEVSPVTFSVETHVNASPETTVVVDINDERQAIDGFGGSLTESSAFVLACIDPAERQAILEELFSESGANFSVARTQIGVSDFSVDGKYSFDDVEGDTLLQYFTLDPHKDGFKRREHPEIIDEHYDVYQLIMDVASIKAKQDDHTFRLMASPWTAPAWMKDNGMWYDKANRYGGALLPKYYQTYADYFVKYLEAYKADGVEFWAVTPENEPMGNDGSWESMHVTPEVEATLIGKYLGPTLEKAGFGNVEIYGFDQNTFEAGPYTAAIYGDSLANIYTDGMALHWYGSSISCFPEVLDSLHKAYPDKQLFHSEGCIDNLGCNAWPGVSDPIGFKESGWFMNDSFWWNKEATDWAYSTPFWPEWHPKYAPVHRYAQYIIDGVNHWLTGYCDWNIVLDSLGGPNHVGNFCGAEVMIDYKSNSVSDPQSNSISDLQSVIYYTPYYYVLKQFSFSMRPGDVVLGITEPSDPDLHVCAVRKQDGSYAVNALNMSKEEKPITIRIANYTAHLTLPANSVETLMVKL